VGHELGGVFGKYMHGWPLRYREAVTKLENHYVRLGQAMGLRVIDVSNVSKATSEPIANVL
jgi:hypothetical protein